MIKIGDFKVRFPTHVLKPAVKLSFYLFFRARKETPNRDLVVINLFQEGRARRPDGVPA